MRDKRIGPRSDSQSRPAREASQGESGPTAWRPAPAEKDSETGSRVRHARAKLIASARVKQEAAEQCGEAIVAAASLIGDAFRRGNKLLLCGNGGSAADCQHMAAEFMSRLTKEFDRAALPAVALTTDSSFLTAFANDCGYEGVFARQVEGLGQTGDVLLGISTSGNSGNVVKAFEMAKRKGMLLIALCGSGGSLPGIADTAVCVPSRDTQHIQECHLAIEHIICELVEQDLFPRSAGTGGTP
jgi:phosphoheptose isomerase